MAQAFADWRLEELGADTTLITVNKRLAADLRRRFDTAQANAGLQVWPSPDILPWQAWLVRSFEHLQDTGFTSHERLNPAQESLLWQSVIRAHTKTRKLLRPTAAADSARDAAGLVHAWRLSDAQLRDCANEQTRIFADWLEAFNTELERRELISAAQLPALIGTAVQAGALPLPARLVYSGFWTLTPIQSTLLEIMHSAGCEIRAHREDPRPSSPVRVEAEDPIHEIRLAAQWALDQIAKCPQARVAVVAPDIARQRPALLRIFGEITTPSAYLDPGMATTTFDISLGKPLADYALVADALLATQLLQGEIALDQMGQLLRSPWIAGHRRDWACRAMFDAALREDGLALLRLPRLQARLAKFLANHGQDCADMAMRLDQATRLAAGLGNTASPAQWASRFQELLSILGWPGDIPLDSREYQQYQRFGTLFVELASLTRVRDRMSLGEALRSLRSLAGSTLFQPESAPAPIQILGPLEAAGMRFDAMWLLGMHDQIWPPAPNPAPLLPTRLQVELDMPQSSATRQLAFAENLTRQLQGGAELVVASHARSDADRDQRPSPLLIEWPLQEISRLTPAAGDRLRQAYGDAGDDEALPTPLPWPPTQTPQGGASLLRAQARCPFQAMARHRLLARPISEPSHAADATLRGELVHAVLQRLWPQIGGSATLARLDSADLQAMIQPLAEDALRHHARNRPDLFTPRFIALETTRINTLLLDWLEVERQRSTAFVVDAVEHQQALSIAGLQLSTRVDRLDRMADGRMVVIDYKTGQQVDTSGWLDERLSEPQLPLYCLSSGSPVAAALFARVRRDKTGCKWVGLADSAGFAPGVATPDEMIEGTDWPDLLSRWQQALQLLADEVRLGRMDPTPSAENCRHCELGPLCRVRNGHQEDRRV